jgi:hypothetical protein
MNRPAQEEEEDLHALRITPADHGRYHLGKLAMVQVLIPGPFSFGHPMMMRLMPFATLFRVFGGGTLC